MMAIALYVERAHLRTMRLLCDPQVLSYGAFAFTYQPYLANNTCVALSAQ